MSSQTIRWISETQAGYAEFYRAFGPTGSVPLPYTVARQAGHNVYMIRQEGAHLNPTSLHNQGFATLSAAQAACLSHAQSNYAVFPSQSPGP